MNLEWIILVSHLIMIQVNCILNPVLHCRSKEPVYCFWFLNTKPVIVNLENGLDYQTDDGFHTTNCSINIVDSVNPKFHGDWACWSQSTDSSRGSRLAVHRYDIEHLYRIKNVSIKSKKKAEANTISAKLGSDVRLKCRFEFSADFYWMRNEEPVKIGGRYRLTNNEEGHYSTDCSLQIQNLSEIDQGSWQCSTYFNNWNGYVQTEPISVLPQGIKKSDGKSRIETEIRVHPQNQSLSVNDDVTIHCSFSHPVACAWFVNNRRLQVHYRFKYLDYTERYQSFSTNCSIHISKITWQEFGEWTCFGQGNATHHSIQTQSALLSEKSFFNQSSKTRVLNIDEIAIEAKISEDVQLLCRFNNYDKITSCKWLRDEVPVLISGRYFSQLLKSTSGFITDCSIKIHKINAIDQGLWKCMAHDSLNNVANIRTNLTVIVIKAPRASNVQTSLVPPFIRRETLSVPPSIGSQTSSVPPLLGNQTSSVPPLIGNRTAFVPPSIERSQNHVKLIVIISSVALFLGVLAAMLLWVNEKRNQTKNSNAPELHLNEIDIENSKEEPLITKKT